MTWTPGWTAAAFATVLFIVWCAAIWNKPTHRNYVDCDCDESHRSEAIMADSLYALSGLWIVAGWHTGDQCPNKDS